jgi:hypothetical protein
VGIGLIFAIVGAAFAASNTTRTLPQPSTSSPRLASAYVPYTFKLSPFVIPPAPSTGLLLKVRIDGGPPLQLLLDSGAQSIVLDRRAAAKSGHTTGTDLDLVGAGSSPRPSGAAMARTVEIGDLVLRDCPLIVVRDKVLDGVDGVIPLALFAGFFIRLDIPARTLELRPYPSERPGDDGALMNVRASQDLLFVNAVLNEARAGYVLLDTGASYSAISEDTARDLGFPHLFSTPVPLQGGAGAVEGRMHSSEVRFRLGSRVVKTNQVVVVGLQAIERYHRLSVAGVLGYPALRESVLSINYRDSMVAIDALH